MNTATHAVTHQMGPSYYISQNSVYYTIVEEEIYMKIPEGMAEVLEEHYGKTSVFSR